jgi:hypothetical protein
VLGTPTNRVYCPVCLRETVVDDKEDEYIWVKKDASVMMVIEIGAKGGKTQMQ